MRSAYVCIAIVALAASSAWSQENPVGATPPQAPIGHRQPTVKDLPPDVARDERPADASRGAQQSAPLPEKNVRARAGSPARGQNVRASAGGPPTLQVGPSCDGVARGSVVLGRVKKACLADETTAQDTLKQNWSKYAAADKTQCTGMVTTGGPASYVELLSSVEILRGTRATSAMPMHSRPTTARSRVSAGVHRGSGWPVLPREGVPVDEAHQ